MIAGGIAFLLIMCVCMIWGLRDSADDDAANPEPQKPRPKASVELQQQHDALTNKQVGSFTAQSGLQLD